METGTKQRHDAGRVVRNEMNKTFEVEMHKFHGGAIRRVDVPADEVRGADDDQILELVFRYGQNDFQPKQMSSVSVGDVVRLNGKRYRVEPMGFATLRTNPANVIPGWNCTDIRNGKTSCVEYGVVERGIATTGRATCRCCGQRIAKGEEVLRFPWDFAKCGSFTATNVQIHAAACVAVRS